MRKLVYIHVFRYQLAKGSYIVVSYVNVDSLVFGERSRIGDLNAIRGLALLRIDDHSTIGNLNWIAGMTLRALMHFLHSRQRSPALHMGLHSSITRRHLIDCTDTFSIGSSSAFAGFRSRVLIHSMNILETVQDCKPVTVGDNALVGTAAIFLPGGSLPSYGVLGASSD